MTNESVTDQLRARLEAKEREREKLAHRLELLDAQLQAWREAIRLLGQHTSEIAPPKGEPEQRLANEPAKRTSRAMNRKWASVFRRLSPSQFNYDDLVQALRLEGDDPNPGSLRGQMMSYIKRDLVERVSAGVFRLTEAGREEAGVENDEGPDAKSEPSKDMGVAGSPDATTADRGPVGSSPTTSIPNSGSEPEAKPQGTNPTTGNLEDWER